MSAIAAPASAKSFRDVWLITIGHGLTHWYPATFYLLLPLIGRELGLSYSEIGFIMTSQYIAGAISNILLFMPGKPQSELHPRAADRTGIPARRGAGR